MDEVARGLDTLLALVVGEANALAVTRLRHCAFRQTPTFLPLPAPFLPTLDLSASEMARTTGGDPSAGADDPFALFAACLALFFWFLEKPAFAAVAPTLSFGILTTLSEGGGRFWPHMKFGAGPMLYIALNPGGDKAPHAGVFASHVKGTVRSMLLRVLSTDAASKTPECPGPGSSC